ncbi:general stress protein [Heyndrickxia sporothermodurans]
MYKVKVVENGLEASNLISELQNEGYSKKEIYIFAHEKDRSKDITDATNTGKVGIEEQGVLNTLENVFRKRGDELRSEMSSLGLSDSQAAECERKLDQGKLIVIASKESLNEFISENPLI